MDSLQRIDRIIEYIQDNPQRLSVILPQLYPIALECEDYEGFYLLVMWEKPMLDTRSANDAQYADALNMLRLSGLTDERISKIQSDCMAMYLATRTIDKDKVYASSAHDMEDYFLRMTALFEAADVPAELNPVDLYFRSEAATKAKISILEQRKVIEAQYSILHSLILSKLARYQMFLNQRERQMKVENGIKNTKNVFVIHGHNEAKRRELVSLLRERFGLTPIILSEQPEQGLTIIEKFEKYATDCSYAFALFTPDDIVTNGDEHYFQARPNVIFELGWFYAHLGRQRVCILDQASEESKIFSDLQGVLRLQFNTNISERYMEIERELRSVGII